MKKAVLIFVFALGIISTLFAFSSGRLPFVESGVLIPLESDIYAKMDALFVLLGKGVPSTTRPWTVAEARNELSILDTSSFEKKRNKKEIEALYNELYEYLFVEDKNTLSLTITLSPEFYAHTNSSFDREEYWNYGYEKRKHAGMIALDNSTHGIYGHLEFSAGKGILADSDAENAVTIKEYVEKMGKTWCGVGTLLSEKDASIKVSTSQNNYSRNFALNIPSANNIDINMPRRAYLNYANSFMSIGIYKSQKSWGYNKGGNFVFDTHNDYYDTVSLKTYSKNFNFEYSFMFPEQYKGGVNRRVDSSQDIKRVFAAHRIEFRLFDCVNIVLSENTMYKFVGYFDIGQLNPSFLYHSNVNNNQFNSLALLEFEYSIIPSLLLYGSWVIDQGSFPGLEDKNTEDQAMGVSLGLEYDTIALGGVITISLEGIYTNPVLYRPTTASDFILNYNIIISKDYYRYPFFTYIGYEYGGDTISLRLDSNYRKNSLHIYSNLSIRWDGEYTFYDKYDCEYPLLKKAPTGDYDVITTFNVGAKCDLDFLQLFPMNAFIDITLVNSKKRGFDAQFALGMSISYSVKTN